MHIAPQLEYRLEEYGSTHRHPVNALLHTVAVPVTMLSIVGLLPTFLAVSLLLSVLFWYAQLDGKIVVPMGIMYAVAIFVTRYIPLPWVIGMFVCGWAVQLLGHAVWEKKRPAFAKNISQLFIGPVYYYLTRTGQWRDTTAPRRRKGPQRPRTPWQK